MENEVIMQREFWGACQLGRLPTAKSLLEDNWNEIDVNWPNSDPSSTWVNNSKQSYQTYLSFDGNHITNIVQMDFFDDCL